MKKGIYPVGLFLTSIIIWLLSYANLPAEIPRQWDFSGQISNYSSKLLLFLLLHGVMLGVYLLLLAAPKIDPKKTNYAYFRKGYYMMLNSILTLFFAINMGLLYVGLGNTLAVHSLVGPLIGMLFIVIGNYMPQIKPNYFIGIRLPWTLANEIVWRKTHQLGGKMFFLGGIILLFLFFLTGIWAGVVIGTAFMIAIVVPIIYSYLIFNRLEN